MSEQDRREIEALNNRISAIMDSHTSVELQRDALLELLTRAREYINAALSAAEARAANVSHPEQDAPRNWTQLLADIDAVLGEGK